MAKKGSIEGSRQELLSTPPDALKAKVEGALAPFRDTDPLSFTHTSWPYNVIHETLKPDRFSIMGIFGNLLVERFLTARRETAGTEKDRIAQLFKHPVDADHPNGKYNATDLVDERFLQDVAQTVALTVEDINTASQSVFQTLHGWHPEDLPHHEQLQAWYAAAKAMYQVGEEFGQSASDSPHGTNQSGAELFRNNVTDVLTRLIPAVGPLTIKDYLALAEHNHIIDVLAGRMTAPELGHVLTSLRRGGTRQQVGHLHPDDFDYSTGTPKLTADTLHQVLEGHESPDTTEIFGCVLTQSSRRIAQAGFGQTHEYGVGLRALYVEGVIKAIGRQVHT